MTREKLIAALEAATGPSRELDEAIAVWRYNAKRDPGAPLATWMAFPANYTASIDAAMTLMPEDTCRTTSVPRQPDMSGKRYWASTRSNLPGARGSTPAIALCIAALKARKETP